MTTKFTTRRQVADGSVPMNRRGLLGRTVALAAAVVLGRPDTGRAQQKMSKQAAQTSGLAEGRPEVHGLPFLIEGARVSWTRARSARTAGATLPAEERFGAAWRRSVD